MKKFPVYVCLVFGMLLFACSSSNDELENPETEPNTESGIIPFSFEVTLDGVQQNWDLEVGGNYKAQADGAIGGGDTGYIAISGPKFNHRDPNNFESFYFPIAIYDTENSVSQNDIRAFAQVGPLPLTTCDNNIEIALRNSGVKVIYHDSQDGEWCFDFNDSNNKFEIIERVNVEELGLSWLEDPFDIRATFSGTLINKTDNSKTIAVTNGKFVGKLFL